MSGGPSCVASLRILRTPRLLPFGSDPQRAGRAEIQRNSDPGRAPEAKRRDQPEAGAERACGGAGRVHGVKTPGIRGAGGVPARRDRIGGAHRNRREADEAEAEGETDDVEAERRVTVRVRPRQRRHRRAQRKRQQERHDGDGKLKRRIGSKGPAASAVGRGHSADRPCPEREAAHESGKHRAGGSDRVAELQRQEARPRDFVHQRGCARSRVAREKETPRRRHC